METLLSLLLNQKVKVKKALPTDNTRIADESSLLIMDILVELEDGELANIVTFHGSSPNICETGQRSACYSADLLLRQYKRVRDIKGDMFSYKDVKKVYTIVLFETSTGVHIDLLQEYIRCGMTPASISGEQHICISSGSQSPI